MIIFMGVMGSGKSVQGTLLAETLGRKWLSTGEYLRANIGGKRREEMLAGKLLDDQEIIEIMEHFFAEVSNPSDVIVDGFPRTLPQAKWLLAEHQKGSLHIGSIIFLKASKEVVRKRLIARGRPDDKPEVIDRRFEEYVRLTLPIIDWFKSQGVVVHEVDAERSVEAIQADILKRISAGDI